MPLVHTDAHTHTHSTHTEHGVKFAAAATDFAQNDTGYNQNLMLRPANLIMLSLLQSGSF